MAFDKKIKDNMQNLQTPSAQFRKQKARLKQMFAELSDSDFYYDYGNKEVMMLHLQNKLGKSRSDLIELMTDFAFKKGR
jgi:hypothetical protein